MKSTRQKMNGMIEELDAFATDFKASAIAAELINNGLSEDQLYFRTLSIFHRQVARDVEQFVWDDESDEIIHRLIMEINREGVYDMIPEALTHSTIAKGDTDDVHEFFEKRRNEENQARKFFSPIENEFEQRILNFEFIEREAYFRNNANRNRSFFEFFYGSSNALNDHQVLILLYLLPLAHKLRGDIKLIQIIFTRLLGLQVEVSKVNVFKKKYISTEQDQELMQLGVNFVLTNYVCLYSWEYHFHINEIPIRDFPLFNANGLYRNIIDFTIPYMIPTNSDFEIHLHVQDSEKQFLLQEDRVCFLEFNTYI